jgi:hypothetical protein
MTTNRRSMDVADLTSEMISVTIATVISNQAAVDFIAQSLTINKTMISVETVAVVIVR